MNILYAIIKNYKNMKEIQCNFGGAHLYSLDDNRLSYMINEKFIPSFFNLIDQKNRANLLNVTGIVGENGTGKSTMLDFILRVFDGTIRTHSPESRYLIIYSVDNHLYYLENLENHILTIEDQKQNIKNNFTLNGLLYHNKRPNSDCNVIFFSNIYDARAIDNSFEISDTNMKPINLSTNYISTRYNSFAESLKSDFTKQFIFLKEYEDYLISNTQLNVPEFITISIDEFNVHYEDDEKYEINPENDQYYSIVSNIDEEFPSIVATYNFDYFQRLFHQHLLMSFFADLLVQIKKLIPTSFLQNTIRDAIEDASKDLFFEHLPEKNKSLYKTLKEILHEKIEEIKKYESLEDKKVEVIVTCKKLIDQLIKSRNKLTKLFNKIYIKDPKNELSITIRTNNEYIKEFVKLYHWTTYNYSYLNFFWSELSSGEHALLTLFGRFHAESKDIKKNILILIDEGDLYFHPQWQKEWFLLFINIITLIFIHSKIHVILTTHSPFVLSDLPGNHVIFLKKDIQGKTITGKGLDENIQTFASNIHTLLIDSFFIKNGLCGSFAKYKINNLIDYILSTDIEKLKLNKTIIKNEIDIIGEPLIKKKIISILQDKIGTDVLNIDDKIANLQKQIDELRKLQQ
ncbi:AAA family ATPase [Paenibacillus sp. FSL H7-0943]|uniref:AAA family ATPase n=1 Tax=Paenibacillus sp. FSL H7-0943 TaxID=2954739 RepID=UPI0030D58ABC